MIFRILLAIVALWFAVPAAHAADGDVYAGNVVNSGSGWRIVGSVYLCDTKANANEGATCTIYDLNNAPTKIPDVLIIEKHLEDDCTGEPSAVITTSPESDGTPAHGIDASTVTIDDNPSRVVINMDGALLDRYLIATLGADPALNGCTDFEIIMHFGMRVDNQ
jgi:hypothetical protein